MRNWLVFLFLIVIFANAQCLLFIKPLLGIKGGLNYGKCDFSPYGRFDGWGMHIGLGTGIEVLGILEIEIAPSFQRSEYSRLVAQSVKVSDTFIVIIPDTLILGEPSGESDVSVITATYQYNNLYLPFTFYLKYATMTLISPYIGIGGAYNFQLSGVQKIESNGNVKENNITDLENDFYLSLILGVDIKLIRLRISPQLSLNYNLTVDNPDTKDQIEKNYDLRISLGLFYIP